MKWLSLTVTGLLTFALLGGGLGYNKGEKKTVEGEGGKKLTLRAPADTSVKQGDTTTIKVAVTRDKFNDLSPKLSIEPTFALWTQEPR
jgi:hypothetical protein